MNASVMTDDLIESGIPVFIGHRAENIRGAQCIIRTAAVHNDNPEVAAARAAGIPVFERAQAWGIIMRAYRNAICLSGTHGKTTTTSMVTHIFMQAQRDPTVMIGGYLPLLHAGHRVGKGDTIIMESCEYCNSFLNFFPTIAVILNIEADHLDFFKDLRDVQASFRRFAQLVPAAAGLDAAVCLAAAVLKLAGAQGGAQQRATGPGRIPGADDPGGHSAAGDGRLDRGAGGFPAGDAAAQQLAGHFSGRRHRRVHHAGAVTRRERRHLVGPVARRKGAKRFAEAFLSQ